MFLLILVIAKGYYGKQVSKDLDNAQRELDQNTAEFIEAKARLELRTRRYKLAEKLAEREIKETKNATKVIRLKKPSHE
jgi:ABC-type transport system involved in cytochrome bd biosynthesis fused ATPase/permease subunit